MTTDAVAAGLPAPGRFERFRNSCGKTWRWLKVDASNAMAKRIGWYGTGTLLLVICALAIWGIAQTAQSGLAAERRYIDTGTLMSYEDKLSCALVFGIGMSLLTIPFIVLGIAAVRKGRRYGNFVIPPQDGVNNDSL